MKKMIQSIKVSLVALGMMVGFGVAGFAPLAMASPGDVITNSCAQQGTANSALCSNNDTKLFGAGSIFTNIINTILYVVGAIAVLMIVIGGLRYVLSAGDTGSVSGAKNTILYAVVGLVIAISAYAIVNFVLAKI